MLNTFLIVEVVSILACSLWTALELSLFWPLFWFALLLGAALDGDPGSLLPNLDWSIRPIFGPPDGLLFIPFFIPAAYSEVSAPMYPLLLRAFAYSSGSPIPPTVGLSSLFRYQAKYSAHSSGEEKCI